jgi:hypothetical protein
MKLKQTSTQQILSLGVQKAFRLNKREVVVHLPAYCIPEPRAYKWTKVQDETFGEVAIFPYLNQRGGWSIKVKFKSLAFNAPLTPKQGRELLEKLKGKQ